MRPKRRGARRRWLVVGATSLAFHGLLGWFLLKGVPAPPVLEEPHSVLVELLNPARPKPPEHKTAEHPAEAAAPRSSLPLAPPRAPAEGAPPAAAKPAPTAGPPEIVAPPGFTARGTLTGGGEALRQAARKSACTEADIVKLTKAERDACAEALGEKHKNGPAMFAAIDPEKKAAFDGDCKKDDEWCLYRTGKGPYPGLFAIGKKKKIKGWDD